MTRKPGMCTDHVNRPAVPGFSRCAECQERGRRKRRNRIAKGFCPQHAKEPLLAGKKHCQRCADKQAAKRQRGMCVGHSNQPSLPGRIVCAKCVNQTLVREYGITLEQYSVRFDEQNGRCKNCGCSKVHILDDAPQNDKLHVDHCHETRQVRWLLCNECNWLLGVIETKATQLRGLLCLLQGRAA